MATFIPDTWLPSTEPGLWCRAGEQSESDARFCLEQSSQTNEVSIDAVHSQPYGGLLQCVIPSHHENRRDIRQGRRVEHGTPYLSLTRFLYPRRMDNDCPSEDLSHCGDSPHRGDLVGSCAIHRRKH